MTERKANHSDKTTTPSANGKATTMTTVIRGIAHKMAGLKRAGTPLPRDTTVVIHEAGEGSSASSLRHVKSRSIVQRAMDLLEQWKFQPASIRSSRLPVDIIALRGDMDLLVQVISSKHPVPDAKTLVETYRRKIDDLRQMGTSARFRKILMAHSVPCGWKHYDVLPGGLVPAWDLHRLPTG